MGYPESLELLDASQVRAKIAHDNPHYVYILYLTNGTPFYVGKGVSDRCLHHEAEARNSRRLTHKLNVIRKAHRMGQLVRYCIESSYSLESEAHARERLLIQTIGRHDLKKGPLTNQTDGGEGASNPSDDSRQRRRESLWGDAEDPERQIANRYFQKLSSVQSVTLKPVKSWKNAAGLWRNRSEFPMSPRQAATLAASAIANRVILEPNAVLPRRLNIEGVEFIIENGVGRDMLSSEMVTLETDEPTKEMLRLTEAGFQYIVASLDKDMLIDAGVISP